MRQPADLWKAGSGRIRSCYKERMDLLEPLAQEPFHHGRQVYVRAPKPIHFPSEERPEEHVAETKRHLLMRTTLFLLLQEAITGAAVGSGQFVYIDAVDPKKCLAPDAFVKLGARNDSFDTWKVWERGAPDLAVQIVSDSDRSEAEWAHKLLRYQASGVVEVVRFDAENDAEPLQIWDRIQGELVKRVASGPAARECMALGMWWVVLPSADGPQLRLARDRDGKRLLPTPNEERLRLTEALAEERKARSLAEHDRTPAEHALREERDARERERAEAAAEIERLRAELARLRG